MDALRNPRNMWILSAIVVVVVFVVVAAPRLRL